MVQKINCDNGLLIQSAEIISSDRIYFDQYQFPKGEFVPLVTNWKQKFDNTPLLIMPAVIDLHVHFRQPGFEHKETIESGLQAALYGGCTTVLDMPNTNPATLTPKDVRVKRQLAAPYFGHLLISGAIADQNCKDIHLLNDYVDAWKVYLDQTFNTIPCSHSSLLTACTSLENINSQLPIFIHAMDSPTHLQTISEENLGITQALDIAKQFSKLHFHITHVSNPSSLQLIRSSYLPNVTLDTCPRYFIPFESQWQLLSRVNPPIREKCIQAEMLKMVLQGNVDILTSDHSPHLVKEKMENAPGVPGTQELFPLMLDLILRLEINDQMKKLLVQLVHTKPKDLIKKAKVKIPRDYLVIDPAETTTINKEWIQTLCKWSLYQNKQVLGKIIGIYRQL